MLKGFGDGGAAQIVRGEFADADEFAFAFDDVLGCQRRGRSEVSSGVFSLKDKSILAARFRIFAVDAVGFEVIVNYGFKHPSEAIDVLCVRPLSGNRSPSIYGCRLTYAGPETLG